MGQTRSRGKRYSNDSKLNYDLKISEITKILENVLKVTEEVKKEEN